MAVPKKRVSRTRKNLRHTNWKKDLIPQALKALSLGKSKQFTQQKAGEDLPKSES
jgi:ribosomal protein L32